VLFYISNSVSDPDPDLIPDSIRSVDPYPDPDSKSVSESRRAKMTTVTKKKKVQNIHVLKCCMFSFESWRLLL